MRQEGLKAVVWNKGTVDIQGKKLNKYVVVGVLITENTIEDCGNETVVIGNLFGGMSDLISSMPKYKCNFPLGDASKALLTVSTIRPDDENLERI